MLQPGNHLILLAKSPLFTIVGATNSYLQSTFKNREEIIGKGLFEVFSDNPQIANRTGVKNLQNSLDYVMEHKVVHQMKDQRYNNFNSKNRTLEFKVWRPIYKVVLDRN